MISGCGQWSHTELWMCPLVKNAGTPGKAVAAFAKMNAAAAAHPTYRPSDAPHGDVESISIQLEAGLVLGLLLTNQMQWKWHVWLLRCISAFVMELRLRTTANYRERHLVSLIGGWRSMRRWVRYHGQWLAPVARHKSRCHGPPPTPQLLAAVCILHWDYLS